ncbi:MAG: hypothetical protein KME19_05385 [Microcoleus vaginatus WJT46-NPBG5]|jgi:multisubunit Na+/H+ antiporter MnhE subunit|nr:hypothetical protein [Microcoleus vaginatus WJT46-NPBG5]
MRLWQFWCQTLILSSQQNPPRFVEMVMLMLAMALLLFWGMTDSWPFLVLSLSYVTGSSVSILIRQRVTPSSYPQLVQWTALLLLIMSLYSIADLAGHL